MNLNDLLENGFSKKEVGEAIEQLLQKKRAPIIVQNYDKGMELKRLAKNLEAAEKLVEKEQAAFNPNAVRNTNELLDQAHARVAEARRKLNDLEYQLQLWQLEEKAKEAAKQLPEALQPAATDYVEAVVSANELRASDHSVGKRLDDKLRDLYVSPTTYFPDQQLDDLKTAKAEINPRLKEAEKLEEDKRLVSRKAHAEYAEQYALKLSKAVHEAEKYITDYNALSSTMNVLAGHGRPLASTVEPYLLNGLKRRANDVLKGLSVIKKA